MIENFGDFARSQSVKVAASQSATDVNAIDKPSQESLIAGDYKKGVVYHRDLKIMIENPAGSMRMGDDWAIVMFNHYGYIDGYMGADGDEIDCYIGDLKYKNFVTVINQHVDGKFDEVKIMIGFPDEDTAMRNYFQNYDMNWPRDGHDIHTIPYPRLIAWLNLHDTTKPYKPF